MPNITTRAGKSATLTHNELDANFVRTVNAQTTTYAILASDNRAMIECSHASTPFTVTMPTVAAAAGEDTGDFECTVYNINAAVVSVDGNGTEPINGSTSVITLKQWDSVTLKLNNAGTGWNAIARVGDLGDIDVVTVTASGDTAAGDNATLGYTATEGAILTGQGSTSDVTLKNDADAEVVTIPTGTTLTKVASDIVLTEASDHEATPGAGFGYLWAKDDTPNSLMFTDDAGNDVNLTQGSNPTGTVIMWTVAAVPAGYLECDGSAVSRTTYAGLFAVIAETYGNGDGSTTFNLPDLRGQFIRGFDNTAGTDPDAASRTDRGDGTTGDNVGTKQADAFEAHTHPQKSQASNAGDQGAGVGKALDGSGTTTQSNTGAASGTTSTETRPTNVGLMFCIKI